MRGTEGLWSMNSSSSGKVADGKGGRDRYEIDLDEVDTYSEDS